jgi:hypothetical protein
MSNLANFSLLDLRTFITSRRLKTILPKISIETSKTGGTGLKIFLDTAVHRKGLTVSMNSEEDPLAEEFLRSPDAGVRKIYGCDVSTVRSR